MMITESKKFSVVCLALVNAMVYAFNALFYCFLPLYFNAKFDSAQAGIVLSVGPAVSIIAPIFWGMLADRAKYKNTVLISTILISAIFFFSMKLDVEFLPMCVLVGTTMLFMSPFAGLIDTITLEYTNEHHLPYGPIRVMGTLGFGLISLILSFFTGNNIHIIFYIFVGMALVCAVLLLLCPRVEGHAHGMKAEKNRKKPAFDLKPLLRAKRLWMIIACMLASQFAYSYYCNFFPSYLKDSLGQPEWVWGLNVLILVCGEIPFFFLYNKIFEKFGIRLVLVVSVIGGAIRYLLLGMCTALVPILILNLLTGFFITVIAYCGATYITNYIAPELQATGQNLMYCVGQGVARVFGGVVGGMIDGAVGTAYGMYIFGGIIAVMAVVCILMVYRDPSPEWMKLKDTENERGKES